MAILKSAVVLGNANINGTTRMLKDLTLDGGIISSINASSTKVWSTDGGIVDLSSTILDKYVKKSGDTMSGTLTVKTTGSGNYDQGIRINRASTSNWALLLIGKSGDSTTGTGTSTAGDGAWLIGTPASSNSLIFNLNNASETVGLCLKGHGNNDIKWNNNTVWHAGNDGSGSGLDADLLDGINSNGFLRRLPWWNNSDTHDVDDLRDGITFAYLNHNAPFVGTIAAFSASDDSGYTLQLQGSYNGNRLTFRNRNGDTGTWGAWREIWHKGNFTPNDYLLRSGGSMTTTSVVTNLNADLLNGYDASTLLHYSGSYTIPGNSTSGSVKKYSKIGSITFNGAWQECGASLTFYDWESRYMMGELKFNMRTSSTVATAGASLVWMNITDKDFTESFRIYKISDGNYDIYFQYPAKTYVNVRFYVMSQYKNDNVTITWQNGSALSETEPSLTPKYISSLSSWVGNANYSLDSNKLNGATASYYATADHTHSLSDIKNKITSSNEFNFVDSEHSNIYFNYRRSSGSAATTATTYFSFYQGTADANAFAYLKGNGFVKNGKDNNDVLLAGGGSKPLTEFKIGDYLPLSGGTMSGAIKFSNNNAQLTFGSLTSSPITGYTFPSMGSNGVGIFSRYGNSSDEGALVLTEDTALLYNSADTGWNFQVHDKDISTTLSDNTRTFGVDQEHYVYSLAGYKKKDSSNDYILLGGGGHKALSDFDSKYVRKDVSDTLNDSVTTTWNLWGQRKLTISGNDIILNMRDCTGGWAGTFLGLQDYDSDGNGAAIEHYSTAFGFYGGGDAPGSKPALNYFYMGGSYSDPVAKLYPTDTNLGTIARFEINKSGNITPRITNTYDLGSTSKYFNNSYLNKIYTTGIKKNERFYPFIGSAAGSNIYKVTFPFPSNVSSSCWQMLSMDLIIGSVHGSKTTAKILLSYYFVYRANNSAWEATNVKGIRIGDDTNNSIKYDITTPNIFYITASDNSSYNTFAICNLTANDSATGYDFLTTTIEAVSSIPASASSTVPISSITTSDGADLKHNGNKIWDADNDGSGSGLDADTLDGNHANAFATSGHTHSISLAADSGTSTITLSHATKYKLTAGGQSVIFTTPSDNNTDTKVTQTISASGNTDYRPMIAGARSTSSTTPTFTDITDTELALAKVIVKPDTGDLHLYNTSGNSPKMYFNSGSMTAGGSIHYDATEECMKFTFS